MKENCKDVALSYSRSADVPICSNCPTPPDSLSLIGAPTPLRLLRTGTPWLRWAVLALAVTIAAGQAQIFTTIKSFGILTNVIGLNPLSTLVQGADGTLYGTTRNGEGSTAGTLFKVQPDGSGFTVLKLFINNSMDGANPFDYLTELQKHAEELAKNPAVWMPWNYRQILQQAGANGDSA